MLVFMQGAVVETRLASASLTGINDRMTAITANVIAFRKIMLLNALLPGRLRFALIVWPALILGVSRKEMSI